MTGYRRPMAVVLVLTLTSWLSLAQAQEKKKEAKDQKEKSQSKVEVTPVYRASVLTDMKVRNPQGEELGDIKDLVVDWETNSVRYAAISVGGFLGIGDKLVAVPIEALRLVHDQEEAYLVLQADKQSLERAPGFSQENWPNVADPRWAKDVDAKFGNLKRVTATVESASEQKLTVKTSDGKKQEFVIGPKTMVVIDGDEADVSNLKKGQQVRIQTVEEQGGRVVRSVEAKSPRVAERQQVEQEEQEEEERSQE